MDSTSKPDLRTDYLFITGASSTESRQYYLERISKFENQGFMPAGRNDVNPIKINIPFDWSWGPEKDPNWRMQCHAWRMLDPYFVAFEETSNIQYIHTIFEYITDWLSWEKKTENTGRAWYDLSVALRACKLSLLSSWYSSGYIIKDYNKCLSNLVHMHYKFLVDNDNFNNGNHGIFQAHGLKALSISDFLPADYQSVASSTADNYLKILLHTQFDTEGIHREGAFEYHYFAIDKFNKIIDSPIWNRNEKIELRNILARAEKNKKWMIYPDGYLVPYGDSMQVKKISKLSYDKLFMNDFECKSFSYGYTFFIKKNTDYFSYLFLSSRKEKGIHSHDDALSLIWHDKGNSILIDAGKYAYVKDSYRKYFISAEAHNKPYIDAKGFDKVVQYYTKDNELYDKDNKQYYLVITEHGSLISRVNDQQHNYYIRRKIILNPGRYLAVQDVLESNIPANFYVNWHINKELLINVHKLDNCNALGGDSAEFSNGVDISCMWKDCAGNKDSYSNVNLINIRGICSFNEYKKIEPCHKIAFKSKVTNCSLISIISINSNEYNLPNIAELFISL